MKPGSKELKNLLGDIPFDVAGSLLYAVALQCFNAPNKIAPGGVGGISILVNYLTGIPISMMSLLLNIPLLILAWFFLGRRFTVKTLKTVLIMTLTLEWAGRTLPGYKGDVILAALYGGVLIGGGLAVVFMRGSTTGGGDIVVRLIQLKLPYLSVGRIMLVVDGCVLLCAALVYRSVETALYAMITIFASSRVMDGIMYGLDMGRLILVVSERYEEIAREVNTGIRRGCTLLEGRGTYTRASRPVLMCAVRKQQFYELKRLVYRIDPTAFMIAVEAGEIVGEGFKDFAQD